MHCHDMSAKLQIDAENGSLAMLGRLGYGDHLQYWIVNSKSEPQCPIQASIGLASQGPILIVRSTIAKRQELRDVLQ